MFMHFVIGLQKALGLQNGCLLYTFMTDEYSQIWVGTFMKFLLTKVVRNGYTHLQNSYWQTWLEMGIHIYKIRIGKRG